MTARRIRQLLPAWASLLTLMLGGPGQAASPSAVPVRLSLHALSNDAIGPSKAGDTRPAGCQPGTACMRGLTGAQLLQLAEQLALARRYDDAQTLLTALAADPRYDFERQFLAAYIASERGDLKAAIAGFRGLLERAPEQPRVRLELARALYLDGQTQAADYHFKLAEQADLPEAIRQTVQQARQAIRTQRQWYANVSFGLAPDTNINSATQDRTVDLFGLPFTLDDAARRTTGLGQTLDGQAGVRLKLAQSWAMGIDLQGAAVNYKGSANDDILLSSSAGPVWSRGNWRVALAGSMTQRWFGGQAASQLFGPRLSILHALDKASSLSLELNARRVNNQINDGYDGWQYSSRLDYERVLDGRLLASLGVFGSYQALELATQSSWEAGIAAGLGGELGLGINAGLSGQISRARYEETAAGFDRRRAEWRAAARIYAGLRSVRLAGFSPAVEYRFSTSASSLDLYDFERHRFSFTLARYF